MSVCLRSRTVCSSASDIQAVGCAATQVVRHRKRRKCIVGLYAVAPEIAWCVVLDTTRETLLGEPDMRTTFAISDDIFTAARHLVFSQQSLAPVGRAARPERNGIPLLPKNKGQQTVTLEPVDQRRNEQS